MDERQDELAGLVTREMGKRVQEAVGELKLCSMILKYYAEKGPGFLEPTPIEPMVGKGEAVVETEPVGVLLAIEPWNYPFYQVVRVAGPNLVLGNTILLKHAEHCPQCALAIEQLFPDAGAPEGVFTNVFLTIPDVEKVIAHRYVQGVTLTGSERAGAASPRSPAGTSRSRCWNWAAATRSSCSTPTTWARPSRRRRWAGCRTPGRPAPRPSG